MHELAYCEGILEAVQRHAAGRRVKRARVRVGVLHRLDQNALQQAFALAASGSEAQDAILDLAFVPAQWRCRLCHEESEGADIALVCSNCGGMEIEMSGGDEIILESVEYEPAVAKSDTE
jgi:hydrogenase nickel incorporation protein HypA/HybF